MPVARSDAYLVARLSDRPVGGVDRTGTVLTVTEAELEQLGINVVRGLAMDAPQKAGSGHPGTAMALAPLAHVLFTRVMRHDPADPHWPDRDRFILSNGHASILLYSLLFLTGYGLTLDDIKQFRQWGSKTPGHPEVHLTDGVEVTTGPLGQGVGNGVGMGIAERWLRARFGPELVDHHTFVFCGDGDLMEGISHEAASLAGHLGLGRLIYVYDDNHITIDGPTELAYNDNVAERFDAYGWHTENLGEVANDTDALEAALRRAMAVEDQALDDPSPQPHRLALAPQDRHRRGPRGPSGRGRGARDQGHPRPSPRRAILGPRRGPRVLPALPRARRGSDTRHGRRASTPGTGTRRCGRRARAVAASRAGPRSSPSSRPAPAWPRAWRSTAASPPPPR